MSDPRVPIVEHDPADDEVFDGDEPFEDAELEFDCHMGRDGSCGKAGSEECEWECPYRGS